MTTTVYKCFCDYDTADCLDAVCQYLRNDKSIELQEEWLAITALLGTNITIHSKAWNDINDELLKLLEASSIRVSAALMLTSKMCLLHKRLPTEIKLPENLTHLRKEILKFIPETSKLAFSGMQVFGRMLPQPDEETFAFYSRVLAGISKLADEEKPEGLSKCMEYFSRKKLNLQVDYPTIVNAPNKGDPDWFLWGFLLLYYSSNKNVATNFKLYSWNNGVWIKKYKSERNGLLIGTPFVIPRAGYQIDVEWTREELHILEQIKEMAPELWKASQNVPKHFDFVPTRTIVEETRADFNEILEEKVNERKKDNIKKINL